MTDEDQAALVPAHAQPPAANTPCVFVVAGEPSGDVLGAELIDELRRRQGGVRIQGVGGPLMRERGADCAVDTAGLQTVGLLDGLKALGRARDVAKEVAAAAREDAPDVVVLIDSWGFSLRVAMALREHNPGIKIVKYIGPQVWASRPGRAKQLAQWVDVLLCIFPFEESFYTPHGLETRVVGYPPVARSVPGDGAVFRARHGLADDDDVLLVLFGSRPKEITRIAAAFEGAVEEILAQRPGVKVVTLVSDAVADLLDARRKDWRFDALVIADEAHKRDAFAAADVALACSGTVTTEVALQNTPVIVGYKIDWLTWLVARSGVLTTKYITLLNVMAGGEIVPEFVQTRCRPDLLSRAALSLFTDDAARERQLGEQGQALDQMGRGADAPVSAAADAVMDALSAG